MKRLTGTVLIPLLFIGAPAFAADAAATLTPEQYYQRASALEAPMQPEIERILHNLVQDKKLPEMSPQYLAAQDQVASIEADMERAAAQDYPPAIYWQSRNRFSAIRHRAGKPDCARLELAAGEGLLAAAVAHVYRCDSGAKSFNFHGPERAAMAEVLKTALERHDPYTAAYPLVLREANCFGVSRPFGLPTEDVAGDLRKLREDVSRALTYDQFRAEAYLFIARNLWNEESLGYLDKAEALGCKDRFNSRKALEELKAGSAQSAN